MKHRDETEVRGGTLVLIREEKKPHRTKITSVAFESAIQASTVNDRRDLLQLKNKVKHVKTRPQIHRTF